MATDTVYIVDTDGTVFPPGIYDKDEAAKTLTTDRDNILLSTSRYVSFYPFIYSPEALDVVQSNLWKNLPMELWLEIIKKDALWEEAAGAVGWLDDEMDGVVNDRCLFERWSQLSPFNHLLSLFGPLVLRKLVRGTWTFRTYNHYLETINSWEIHLENAASLMRGVTIVVDPRNDREAKAILEAVLDLDLKMICLDLSVCGSDIGRISDSFWETVCTISHPASAFHVRIPNNYDGRDDDEEWISKRDMNAPKPWVERARLFEETREW